MFWKKRSAVDALPAGLLETLWRIGVAKNAVPFEYHARIDHTGLSVHLNYPAGRARLLAGGKYKRRLSAWYTLDRDVDFGRRNFVLDTVDRYEPGAWEQLVIPAFAVAMWLALWQRGGFGDRTFDDRLAAALAERDRTGLWQLLTADETTVINRAIEYGLPGVF